MGSSHQTLCLKWSPGLGKFDFLHFPSRLCVFTTDNKPGYSEPQTTKISGLRGILDHKWCPLGVHPPPRTSKKEIMVFAPQPTLKQPSGCTFICGLYGASTSKTTKHRFIVDNFGIFWNRNRHIWFTFPPHFFWLPDTNPT